MRTIKMQFWDSESSTMIQLGTNSDFEVFFSKEGEMEIYGVFEGSDGGWEHHKREGTIRQFTGLLDKNGKEIYEGDIIEKFQLNKPYSENKKECRVRYEVKWREQNATNNELNNKILKKDPSSFNEEPGFYGKEIWNEKGYYCHNWSEFASCEIIGNIYENPDLISNNQ